ncbi:response regulator [Herbaspirillum sp. LeCh32-8]|uniref:response regulator n=1 Tax=Herbaspirillum sp. LeCh32-8 TaxID=2821356 RepID=UPI001AE11CCB|nr:response regulator [Herbaspirillum sp. LeCh32-8]MBP0600012.1 response regulator [Herbaspirillum sp. LeCh32-8]
MNLPSIVMIDSSPEATEMVRFALWRANLRCSFQAFPDAATARRCLLQQRRRSSDGPAPALILLESDLDYTDGLDVLRELRADAGMAKVPVVVFPSYDMEGEQAALAAGATEYMPKPVDAELYARCIAEFYQRWCQPQATPSGRPAWQAPSGMRHARRRSDWMRPAAQWNTPNSGN